MFGSDGISIDPQTFKLASVMPDFDNDTYGYICIEDIECGVCAGGACSGFKDAYEAQWVDFDFFDNSTTAVYMYDSELVYECGAAREFDDGAGGTQPDVTLECQWDETWSPVSSLPLCQWTHCLAPPDAPNATSLTPDSWDGNPVNFNDFVDYTCERGQKFESDFAKTHEPVECLPNNLWDTPTVWPICVETKTCPAAPSPPTGGTVKAVSAGYTYGTICEGSDGWSNVTGTNDVVEVIEKSSGTESVAGFPGNQALVTKYDLLVKTPTPPGTMKALMSFTQPLDLYPNAVEVSGALATTLTPTVGDNVFLLTAEMDPSTAILENFLQLTIRTPVNGDTACLAEMNVEMCATNAECDVIDQETFSEANVTSKIEAVKYGATLEYECSLGQEFQTSPGVFATTQTLRCEWDETWQPPATITNLATCSWVACINPPTYAADAHLNPIYTKGTTVAFNDYVTYECESGFHFDEDFNMASFDLQCLPDGSWENLPDKRCIDPLERYCPDPPVPPFNGGLTTWPLALSTVTPYAYKVTYTCDEARKLRKLDFLPNATVIEVFYDSVELTCEWNQTWSPPGPVDPCVWRQCIDPPLPPGLNLRSLWASDPVPVEFGETARYECEFAGLWFEEDRDMTGFELECLPDGTFDEPDPWPKCVPDIECEEPPEKPRGGSKIGGGRNYGAEIEYGCGPYAQFEPLDGGDAYDTTLIRCQWNKNWTLQVSNTGCLRVIGRNLCNTGCLRDIGQNLCNTGCQRVMGQNKNLL